MKKILLVPDSFKGTMSSREICSIMRDEILGLEPSCRVIAIPTADGGEGTVDAFAEALGGEKKYLTVRGPMGSPVEGFYAVCGEIAVVEMAAAAGLPLMNDALCVEQASTYGVGELLCAAAPGTGCKASDPRGRELLPTTGDAARPPRWVCAFFGTAVNALSRPAVRWKTSRASDLSGVDPARGRWS